MGRTSKGMLMQQACDIYLPPCIPPRIKQTDADDDRHQPDEQPLHRLIPHPAVQLPADDPAADTPCRHQYQHRPAERRDRAVEKRGKQIAYLAEQDDIQTVGGGGLGVHAEKVVQHHQIDGPAADAQKAGHRPQRQPYDNTDGKILNAPGGNTGLVDRIQQRSRGHNRQTGGLDRSHRVRRAGQLPHGGKQLVPNQAARRRANGQRRPRLQGDAALFCQEGFPHRIAAHGQHRAAGQKADGGYRLQMEQVQHRLDDHPAADAADRSRDAGRQGHKKKDQHDSRLLTAQYRSPGSCGSL